jgi:hypothetical protein
MTSDHSSLGESPVSTFSAIPDANEFEDDDRDITAITALERETRKTEVTLAKLRDSVTATPIKAVGPPTPPPIRTSTQDPRNTWVTRALYNNSVFDVGISLTLGKDQVLALDEAVANVVRRTEGVEKVMLILIEGELTIARGSSHYRTLKILGQSASFVRRAMDFNTIQLVANCRRTRMLVVVWRTDGAKS